MFDLTLAEMGSKVFYALLKTASLTMIIWSLAVILGGVTDDAENQILPLFVGLFLGVMIWL